MKKYFVKFWLIVSLLWAAPALADSSSAVEQIRTNATEVLRILNEDNGSNSAEVRAKAERYATPYFDFERMTALAVGLPWRNATPAQKTQLADAFKNRLIRIYSGTMLQYKNAQVKVLDNPTVAKNGREVTVHSEITPNAGNQTQPIKISYTTYKSGDRYRIYDVKVEGQSLVTVYRNQFGEIVRQKGIDGLIEEFNKDGK